jgi:exonuclease III
MQYTYTIASLNINGIASPTRMCMLNTFLYRQGVDVALLQEVTHYNFDTILGYGAYLNVGSEKRGTAILTKRGINVGDIKRFPSGPGMAASLMGVWIINVYAPSGAEKRNEREAFLNKDITHLLPQVNNIIIMAGDCNCVTSPSETTGASNMRRALTSLLRGIGLQDTWEGNPARPIFTHYTSGGASRIDRIYITDDLRDPKQGAEIIPAAFTDHLAVTLRKNSSGNTHYGDLSLGE